MIKSCYDLSERTIQQENSRRYIHRTIPAFMRFSRLLQSVVSFREGACTDLPISLSRTWDKVTNLSLIFLAPVESWGGARDQGCASNANPGSLRTPREPWHFGPSWFRRKNFPCGSLVKGSRYETPHESCERDKRSLFRPD